MGRVGGVLSEVGILADELPIVFEQRPLPPDWDDEWIFVPEESPETTDISREPMVELFNESRFPLLQELTPASFLERLPNEMTTGFAGAGIKSWSSLYPPPDALAFYLPFHYFYPTWWGIYLVVEGVHRLAEILKSAGRGSLETQDCVVASRIFLFGHEQYHHCVESLSARLEVTHRNPAYKTGFEAHYRKTYNTPDCIEEALANAHALKRTLNAFKADPTKQRNLQKAFVEYLEHCPPGYNRAMEFTTPGPFKRAERRLAEDSHKASFPDIPDARPRLWKAFPHSFHPFRKRRSRVNYIVHRDSALVDRSMLSGRYLRYSELKKRLNSRGYSFVRQGKGSHEIWRGPSGTKFSVPRHPGDLKRGTLSAILKQAGIDLSLAEFVAR